MDNTFVQFATVLGLSSALGYIVYRLKLPLVIAYILAGVILSAFSGFNSHTLGIFEFLPDLGIAFVLFLIGMELDLRELKELGKPIITSSLAQIVISTLAGYAIAGYLGFSQAGSLYMGIGLGFSSTLVVVKMLLEKKDLASLYGKLSIGILLLEDLVAIGVLMVISVGSSAFNVGLQQSFPILITVLKALILFGLTYLCSKYLLEKIFDAVAKSVELLFLTAITWCFIFTSIALLLSFSVVIGAFLAGLALASSPYHLQIQGKIKPLRDFFVTMFFVFLGSQVNIRDLYTVWPIVLVFTAYALIVKPFIFVLILGTFGFKKHTFFQTALNLSQISEFSLVVLLIGVKTGAVPSSVLSVMAAVAVLSIMASAVLITHFRSIYEFLSPFLSFFEHKNKLHFFETDIEHAMQEHVILIGAHRVGSPILNYLRKSEIPFIVLDFNPHVVAEYRKKGINIIYGDVGDPEILDNLGLETAKLIISTANDNDDNEMLLIECKRRKIKAKVIVRATDEIYAKELKALGADFVILPEQVSGDYLADQLKAHWPNVAFNGL